jgi:hypothetical protein
MQQNDVLWCLSLVTNLPVAKTLYLTPAYDSETVETLMVYRFLSLIVKYHKNTPARAVLLPDNSLTCLGQHANYLKYFLFGLGSPIN